MEPTKKTKVELEEGKSLSTEDTQKIIEAVELWFGDNNLAFDTFLMSEIAKTKEGWVPIETLCTFSTLKNVTTSTVAVVEALQKSKNLSLNSEKNSVRRNEAIPGNFDHVLDRTVYIKGLPQNQDDAPTWEKIKETFEKEGKGEIELVKLRYWIHPKTKEKNRKPSVFLLFKKLEDAKKAAEGLEWNGKALLTMPIKKYYEDKKEEAKKALFQKAERSGKKQQEKKKESKKKEEEPRKPKNIAGCMVKFENIGTSPDLTFQTLKQEFTRYGTVSFVDWEQGNTSGVLRFDEPEHVENLMNCYQTDEFEIAGGKPTFAKLQGEEEEKYIEDYNKKMADFKPKTSNRGRGGGRGRGRGGRGGRGKKKY